MRAVSGIIALPGTFAVLWGVRQWCGREYKCELHLVVGVALQRVRMGLNTRTAEMSAGLRVSAPPSPPLLFIRFPCVLERSPLSVGSN